VTSAKRRQGAGKIWGTFALAVPLAVGTALPGGGVRAGENEWVLSATAGYARLAADERKPSGGAVVVDLERGLDDAWSARLTLSYSPFPVEATMRQPGDGLGSVVAAVAGVTYAFDVLRVVPYLNAGFGVVLRGGTLPAKTDPAVDVGVGMDYLWTRAVSVGVVARYHAFLTELSRDPVFLYVGPRLSWHW
jgi:hypothetical protein